MSSVRQRPDLDTLVKGDPGQARHMTVVVTSPSLWRIVARTAYLRLCATGEPFSADDLRRAVPESPSATEAAWGAVFQWGALNGHAVRVGMTTSRRPEAKYRRVPFWCGQPRTL